MKKIKVFLLIIFILLFLINNIFIPKKNNFSNLQIQTEYDKYTKNQDTAVSLLKPTLTLYYDRYDVNSKYFYDDTRTYQLKKLLGHKELIEGLEEEFEFLKDTFNTIIKDGIQKIYKHDKGKKDKIYTDKPQFITTGYEINWSSHFCFRTTTNGRRHGNEDETYYIKNDYLLTNIIEKILYKSLRLSEYDFEEFITLFEAVRTHLDTYNDLFNRHQDVNRGKDFYWHSDVRFTLKDDTDFEKNTSVKNLNKYLEDRYKKLKEGLITKKNSMIDNMIERNNLGVWNQIKLLYETESFPYLNHKLLTLEEIYCQDGKMPTCISNEITTFKKDPKYYKEIYENDNTDSPTDSPKLLEEEILIDNRKTRQFPRNEELVDKLPKVIFTYQKYEYDGLIDGVNTKLIEYDGIYNINNQFIKKGRNNILKFLVDMMEENCEIKQGGDKEGKIHFHNDTINNINNNVENKEEEIHEFNDSIKIENIVMEDIKTNPNFDLNFDSLIKCNKCSEFIKI
tara:strand:+ start:8779 stop:10302 length:1524 start_codon:yes stop_codon:yes gene_type:complete